MRKVSKNRGTERLKPAKASSQRLVSESISQFDAETGQVFVETTVRFNSRQRSDWIGELKTPDLLQRARPNERGARSLLEMAKRRTARQFRDLTADHFSVVPWALASKVWEELIATRGESFHAWRTLAESYSASREFGRLPAYRYHLDFRQPALPLQTYFKGVTSDDTKWMTCLRISPKQTSTVDLVAVASIKNLAVLDLSDGQVKIDHNVSHFDERVMRTWANLARSECRFRHLRALLLGWQENISSWIFDYVDSFPSLCHIVITDCPQMHQKNRSDWEPAAVVHGWEARHSKRSAKSLRPVLDDKTFHLGAVSGLYYESEQLFRDLADQRRPELEERLPVLECWLGTPRRWTHIVDDFPANRTIFFDNVKTRFRLDGVKQFRPPVVSDPAKPMRDEDQQSLPEIRSPPPKRIPRSELKLKPKGRNIQDLLEEFKSC